MSDSGRSAGEAADATPTWPAVAVVLAVLWLFVNGVPLAPAPIAGQFLLGLVLGVPIAYASRRFYWTEARPLRFVRVSPVAARYVAVFVWDLIVANLDVAYRVLAPSMPIEPRVIVLPLRVRSDVAITTIANSITLTPGTLTMDYDSERNALYVHAIDGRDPAAVVRPIRRWEDYALVIFDEAVDPAEAPPAGAAYAVPASTPGASGTGGDAGGG